MKEDNIIFPNYEHSILNLINTILKYYNIETMYNSLPKLQNIIKKQYKNIVLIILDGMGEHILKNISPNGFFCKNHKDTITSVCPSTTTAAMTTYYSGKPPIETGWIAMSQYFKEYGRSIEMLRKIDSYTHEEIDISRMNIYDLIKYIPIYEQIENKNPCIKTYEIIPEKCLSLRKRTIRANTIESMCNIIKTICNDNEQNFILAYNDNPDLILHKYGCNSNEVKNFIQLAENEIEKMCKSLEKSDTLIIISADHGHKDIQKVYNILDLKDIQDCLIMPPSLESRAITFFVKQNEKQKFEKIFKSKFKNEFMLFTKEEFLEKKLLGNGIKHKKIDDFLGNYIAVSIADSIIKLETYISKEKANKKSTHCGFTANEMEVPLIIVSCK